jgi:hypothetical protein
MKTVISKADYIQIVGLLALSERYIGILKDLEKSLAGIVGQESDDNYYGHCSDAVYGTYSADELLRKMEIKVKK